VDIAGINRLSRAILGNAAAAIAAMVQAQRKGDRGQGSGMDIGKPQTAIAGVLVPSRLTPHSSPDKPLIAMTMFGVTTPCVLAAQRILEDAGCECLVFHATGTGGRAMESLIDDGFISAVCDVTTTEWADELAGGVLSAGPTRLEAAGRRGIPQVVSVGALDMVNFGPRDTVPAKFAGRLFYQHNPTVTLMRTTVEENRRLGEIIAGKLNAARGPVRLYLPLKGLSAIDAEGKPFHDPAARAALYEALEKNLDRKRVEPVKLDRHINDEAFAEALARGLLEMMKAGRA
jgi:uncharacterized protein (UPF0261 family)